jgi:hypothetical protein
MWPMWPLSLHFNLYAVTDIVIQNIPLWPFHLPLGNLTHTQLSSLILQALPLTLLWPLASLLLLSLSERLPGYLYSLLPHFYQFLLNQWGLPQCSTMFYTKSHTHTNHQSIFIPFVKQLSVTVTKCQR